MGLLTGSVAIGNAVQALCLAIDQRGYLRADGDCDTGAFERGAIACIDLDADGYGNPASPACGHPELDCDDGDATVNPGATEIPGNGIDDDCNPLTPPGCGSEGGPTA